MASAPFGPIIGVLALWHEQNVTVASRRPRIARMEPRLTDKFMEYIVDMCAMVKAHFYLELRRTVVNSSTLFIEKLHKNCKESH